MYGTVELTEDLASYFSVPRYTQVLFTLDMYMDFKKSVYESGNPDIIDDLDSVEYLMKDLSPRQKEIVKLSEQPGPRKRISYSLGTSLSTVKREIKNIKGVFSRLLLPDLSPEKSDFYT